MYICVCGGVCEAFAFLCFYFLEQISRNMHTKAVCIQNSIDCFCLRSRRHPHIGNLYFYLTMQQSTLKIYIKFDFSAHTKYKVSLKLAMGYLNCQAKGCFIVCIKSVWILTYVNKATTICRMQL